MAISKDWYHTEMENNEMEILHRSPSVEYSFYCGNCRHADPLLH